MERLHVNTSPHMHTSESTTKIMGHVILALMPALGMSLYYFGIQSIYLVCCTVLGAVAGEELVCRMRRRKSTLGDLSAVVTGVILGCCLPPALPMWMGALGGLFSTVVVKGLFGGIGKNFANPAAVGRIFLMVSFAGPMTQWTMPRGMDAIASATPLGGAQTSYWQLFIGEHGGCLGEISAAALLLGGLYLIITRVISPLTPAVYIGGVFLFTWALGGDPVKGILTGGVMLAAFFMATDYTTSPVTPLGKGIFALGMAFFTVLIRVYGNYPEGVSFAILLMNILVPQIDRLTRPKLLGGGK